jgi:hypothetical protein
MSETTSSNTTLYFLVGGLLVAVLGIGYFAIGRNSSDDTSGAPSVSAKGPDDGTGSSFKLNVEKDGSVSGSLDQKPSE